MVYIQISVLPYIKLRMYCSILALIVTNRGTFINNNNGTLLILKKAKSD